MTRSSRGAALRMLLCTPLIAGLAGSSADAATVTFDTSRCPQSKAWADAAQALGREWYPRLGNLMTSSGDKPLPDVTVVVNPEFKGVAAASGAAIEIAAEWVTRHPEDSRGALIHELVHVVQAYPPGQEGWLTEGIADYFRYAVYESRPLSEFPRPEKPRGYLDSYQVAAGFLFWLECGPAPGIVRQLNTALRLGQYQESLFTDRTGHSVSDLWNRYLADFKSQTELPREPRIWRHARGSFERQPDSTWSEVENGKPRWQFTETARTPHSIELFDAGRNIRLKITAQSVQLATKNGWSPLYSGRWSPASSEKPPAH